MSWLGTNVRLAAIRLASLFVRLGPTPRTRAYMLDTIGTLAGLILTPVLYWRRRPVAALGRRIRPKQAAPFFIIKGIVQSGRDYGWGFVLGDAPAVGRGLVAARGAEPLLADIAAARGAVMVGAHYGPMLDQNAIRALGLGIGAMAVVNDRGRQVWSDLSNLGISVLKPASMRLADEPRLTAVAGREEKKLVKHLKNGGAVFVSDDLPQKSSGLDCRVAGLPARLSYFPFKLALRYEKPLYLTCFKRDGMRGIVWVIEKAPFFATPEEGLACYAEWLSGLVEENPYMWHGARFY